MILPLLFLAILSVGCSEIRRDPDSAVVPSPTTAENATKTLTGSFEIRDLAYQEQAGGPCSGSDGYSDIDAGTAISIKNGSGQLIAVGSLGAGVRVATPDAEQYMVGGRIQTYCVFPIEVKGIPVSDFYQIEVGRRGVLPYTREALEQKNWQLTITLG